jgi:two-component system, chemotaxis family, protein-glutamate methylesterase/glutaminase
VNTVLIASPSTFLRMALIQQLRRRRRNIVCAEAATGTEAAKIFAGGGIDLAIVDNALLATPAGERLIATIERHDGRGLLIETREPKSPPPAGARTLRSISGVVDGTLDMGAIAHSLPAALDEVAVERGGGRPTLFAAPLTPIVHEAARCTSRRLPEVMLLAASTGGPSAITLLLRHLGSPRLPMLIAQHMPADQTAGFARYLAAESGFDVIERGAGDLPSNAQVVVLRGGSDYRLARGRTGHFRLIPTEVAGNVFHPSADLLFGSAAEAGMAVIAVVLSGMGEDGSSGAAAVAARGGRVLVQDFASCVVAGMPSATRAICPSAVVASVPEIAERLSRWSMAPTIGAAAIAEG